MPRVIRIVTLALAGLAAFCAALAGIYALWARPGRLDEAACREMVVRAWESAGNAPAGDSMKLEYGLGDTDRLRFPAGNLVESGPFADRLRELFPQVELPGEFLDTVSLRHAGRRFCAGRVCERVRLLPSSYRGDFVELWIDSGSGALAGWRRYDSAGEFVRGYFRTRNGRAQGRQQLPPFVSGILESRMMPPEEVTRIASSGALVLPERLPPNFRLVGGRRLPAGELLGRLRQDRLPQGMGRGHMWGRMREELEPVQLVYSDGLNTITVMEYRLPGMMGEGWRLRVDDSVIAAKSREVRRIFHTSMSGRLLPGVLVLLFGEVDQSVLDDVAASFPEKGLFLPPPPPFDPGAEPVPSPPAGFPPGPHGGRPDVPPVSDPE